MSDRTDDPGRVLDVLAKIEELLWQINEKTPELDATPNLDAGVRGVPYLAELREAFYRCQHEPGFGPARLSRYVGEFLRVNP